MAFGDRPPGCPPEINALEQYGGNWPEDKRFRSLPRKHGGSCADIP